MEIDNIDPLYPYIGGQNTYMMSEQARKDLYKEALKKMRADRKTNKKEIEDHYDDLKKKEINKLTLHHTALEGQLMSRLGVDLSVLGVPVTRSRRLKVWKNKYTTAMEAICVVCNSVKINMNNFEIGFLSSTIKSEAGNSIPICPDCYKRLSHSNILSYHQLTHPMTNIQMVYNSLVEPYRIFKLVGQSPEIISIGDLTGRPQTEFRILEVDFNNLNKRLNNSANVEVMKKIGVIKDETTLYISYCTGNPIDKAYTINIELLWAYILIIQPE